MNTVKLAVKNRSKAPERVKMFIGEGQFVIPNGKNRVMPYHDVVIGKMNGRMIVAESDRNYRNGVGTLSNPIIGPTGGTPTGPTQPGGTGGGISGPSTPATGGGGLTPSGSGTNTGTGTGPALSSPPQIATSGNSGGVSTGPAGGGATTTAPTASAPTGTAQTAPVGGAQTDDLTDPANEADKETVSGNTMIIAPNSVGGIPSGGGALGGGGGGGMLETAPPEQSAAPGGLNLMLIGAVGGVGVLSYLLYKHFNS